MTTTRTPRLGRFATCAALTLAVAGGLTGCGSGDTPGPDVNIKNAATAPAKETAPPMTASPPKRLQIPSADVDAGPFVPLEVDGSGELGVPPVSKAEQPGWWTKSPTPGAKGASIIVAHYDTKNGPALMKNVKNIKVGDVIKVLREDGSTATFKIRERQQVKKDAFPTQKVYGDTDRPELRLLTCGGEIVDGHRSANIIFYADLVK
ncbi:putative peptidase C60 family protein [Streptomyces sp. NBRC 110611]|uniref:class F sortase n=1 Tax=Streptomyces sp. NBRC 110611 TaxID=1621259 RepID=UPI00082D52D3|nr:class F sortase [Streptomyces sp. NBRC 110611]GAU70383.1 putative peptidase C60 family protein [Streptomyces sp. NBRC 110611]